MVKLLGVMTGLALRFAFFTGAVYLAILSLQYIGWI